MQQIWERITEAFANLDPTGYLALVAVVAIFAQWLAWRVKVPSILLLLVIGFGMGQLANPDDVLGREVLFSGVTLAVGVILFEGALTLRFRDVRDLGRPVFRLCTVTVAITWALITVAAWLVGFEWEIALLVGAILVVTGPTVIGPILRTLRPTRRVASLLTWEGIVVDPIGAVLAVLVFQGVLLGRGGDRLTTLLGTLGLTILVAAVLGLGLGVGLELVVKHNKIPDFLLGVSFVGTAVAALVVSNAIQSESGLLTVTVLGIYLGNRKDLHLRPVEEFSEHLQVLFVGVLFVILAGRVAPADVVAVAPTGLLFVLILVVVVRPAGVLLGLIGTKVSKEERHLLAFMAPRGIVAAAVTSIFGLEFTSAADKAREAAILATGDEADALSGRADNLFQLAGQATELVPLVFLVIVCTVALYGLGVGRLAERLGLATTSPQGVLFVGGQKWVLEVALALKGAGVPVTVVTSEYEKTAQARRVGVDAVLANILSEFAVKDLDLAGTRTLIAATSEDEVNFTAAREFSQVLGRANVFQLPRDDNPGGTASLRTEAAPHLTARACFEPPRTNTQLKELVAAGHQVKHTKLTPRFTLDDFRRTWGQETVLLFVLDGGEVNVVTDRIRVPQHGVSVIALVPPESVAV
ncbi:cation:proton antiporter [Tessaracoccus antarcticus]|uniref:cation:proton antiporter n=1 Tax=Tessaracoccus antarcticus TaxID=2479848 RepID=UPI0018F5401C|nr:cation:proton antiporter [Tessaracoccus antarcticus]